MTDPDRRARLVLDITAVTAFASATGSVSVGELLAALTAGVDVMTRRPKPYAGLGEDLTLPFED